MGGMHPAPGPALETHGHVSEARSEVGQQFDRFFEHLDRGLAEQSVQFEALVRDLLDRQTRQLFLGMGAAMVILALIAFGVAPR